MAEEHGRGKLLSSGRPGNRGRSVGAEDKMNLFMAHLQ